MPTSKEKLKVLYLGSYEMVQSNEDIDIIYREEGTEGYYQSNTKKPLLSRIYQRITRYQQVTDEADLVILDTTPFTKSKRRVIQGLNLLTLKISNTLLLRKLRALALPFVVVDLRDDLIIQKLDLELYKQCILYFKREAAIDFLRSTESLKSGGLRDLKANEQPKILPVSIGLGRSEESIQEIFKDGIPLPENKSTDLFFAGGGEGRPIRQEAFRELSSSSLGDLKVKILEESVAFEEYVNLIRNSWLCLSPPGFGWDCYRHYEIGLLGSVPVLSRPDIRLDCGFVHGKSAIFYDPEYPLLEQLLPWLEDKDLLLKMSKNAQKCVMDDHTASSRFKRMTCSIREKMNASL